MALGNVCVCVFLDQSTRIGECRLVERLLLSVFVVVEIGSQRQYRCTILFKIGKDETSEKAR